MTTRFVLNRSFTARSSAIALGLLLAAGAGADAQRRGEAPRLDTPGVPEPSPVRRGFNLFGNADIAGSGLRMTGTFAVGLTNFGICQDIGIVFQFFNVS